MAFLFKDSMRNRFIVASALAVTLVLAPAPAFAASSSLADHMADSQGTMWDKLEAWLTSWHAEQHGDAVAPEPAPTTPAPAPAPTTAPVGNTTGGTGGAYTDRLSQSFTSNGLTSKYHIYAEGLDKSKPVGLLMYGDGSGGSGFDRPDAPYLIGGSTGLKAVAKKHNMVLVVPEAPAPGCDGYDNCWYDRSAPAKAKWSSDLMTKVKGEYPINTDRIVTGGYSSGAQWHRWFLPQHGEAQSVDLAVMIAYGGAPAVRADYSDEYKDDLILSWDTGTSDAAYTTASYGARGGHQWYKNAGFQVDATWPSGVGHSRSGQFGAILDREITQHLK